MKKTVLYLGRFGSEKTASGIRVRMISAILRNIGYNVVLISNSSEGTSSENTDEESEFTFLRVPYREKKRCSFENMIDVLFGSYEFKYFKGIYNKYKPSAVILYNETSTICDLVTKYVHANGGSVFADVTEWYELISLRNSIAGALLTRKVDKRIRASDYKLDGVIAISDFFFNYYKEKKVTVVRIPPIFDEEAFAKHITLSCNKAMNPLRIVYAGSPGTKDILLPVFDAIKEINDGDSGSIIFDIYGMTSGQISAMWKEERSPEECGIIGHGVADHERVLSEVSKAHYSILLRHNKLYAKAGYSTKFAESLLLGTPVICNRIGGTDSDIIPGENGYLIDSASKEALIPLLRKLLYFQIDEYRRLRETTLFFAREKYCADMYTSELRELIELRRN